ncbi:hypothetical protein M7I_6064 [Glarea lozoyensis 74030]|uniref:Uncharacterized protein n=1 Tax=Glarea lozoyensis (strain ATCC 74030 / MF5533) TaxID=1104152 RepID=H0ETK0_GLAL7|nr:hypothetical protein M7I_6064 [Glarea lozoyensis 74030]
MSIHDRPSSSRSARTQEETRLTRKLDRGAPGDQAIFSDNKTPEQRQVARKRSQYYQETFAAREPNSSARERVSRDSMVIAEIKTNVIPVTNKRNSTLLSKAMEEGLGVPPNRGIIKFIAIAEEDFATDGKTVAREIEELERKSLEDGSAIQRGLSKASGKGRKKSMKSLRKFRSNSQLATHEEAMTPPLSGRENSPTLPPLPPTPSTKSVHDRQAEKVQKMGRRKSFMATLLGK